MEAWFRALAEYGRSRKRERRLLTRAIVGRRVLNLRVGLRVLRRRLKCAIKRGGGVLLWQKGEVYQRQRRRRLASGMRALLSNTSKHRLLGAAAHHDGRLKALVFGAWARWHRDEEAQRIQADHLGRAADVRRLGYLGLRRWLSASSRGVIRSHNHKLAFIFEVLILYRYGLNMLGSHVRRQQALLARQRGASASGTTTRLHSLRRCCKAWRDSVTRRQAAVFKALRANLGAARHAVEAFRALVERRGQQQGATAALNAGKASARRRRNSALQRWILWVFASRRGRWLALTAGSARRGAQAMRGLAALWRHRLNHQIALETAAVADTFAKQMPVAARSYFNRWRLVSCERRGPSTSVAAERLAAIAGRRRGILAWLRHLKARILQSLLHQRALDQLAYGWSFRRRACMLQRWVAHRLRRRVIEERRLALAGWCYASRRKRRGVKALRQFVRLARCGASAGLLGEFKFSRRVVGLGWRTLQSNREARLLVRSSLLRSVLYWKLFRFGSALVQWHAFVSIRKQCRLEWLASQQRHRDNVTTLGCRLWFSAAGSRTARSREFRLGTLAAKVVRQWRAFVVRARTHRGERADGWLLPSPHAVPIAPYYSAVLPPPPLPLLSLSSRPALEVPLCGASSEAPAAPPVPSSGPEHLSRAPPRPLLPEYSALPLPLPLRGASSLQSAFGPSSVLSSRLSSEDHQSPPRPGPPSKSLAMQSPLSVAASELHDAPEPGESAEQVKRIQLAKEILKFVHDFQSM